MPGTRITRFSCAIGLIVSIGFLLSSRVTAQGAPSPLLKDFVWRPIGPVNMGGRIDDVEAVERNPSTIYVGAATSGVWKTDNNGATWIPVFDGQPNLSIGDIAIAPSNPNIVWVGTGEANGRQSTSYGGGVFKSTDAGKNWSFMGLRDSGSIGRILIDPKSPDIVYIAAAGDIFKAHPERGLYKTTNGGNTWTKSKFIDDDTGFIDAAMDPSDSQVIVAASYQRRRTAWGFNGGGPGSAIWKTTDAGKTWKKIEGGALPPYGQWGRVGLGFSRSNPNVLYAMIEPGPQQGGQGQASPSPLDPRRAGVWRSDDKGATWRLTSNENGRPMYFSQIRVDPTDANTVWSLQRSLYKSTDGAKTFTMLPEAILGRLPQPTVTPVVPVAPFDREPDAALPPSHPDHHAMWIDPANPLHVILGHDGGVDFSYDGGKSWQLQNWMPMGQFYQVSVDTRQPYYVYGGAQDNGIWGGPSRVRNNGGITKEHWFELAAGDGFHVQVDPTDWAIVYMSVSGNGGQFLWRHSLRTGEQKFIRPTPPRRADDRRNQTALPAAGNIVNSLEPNEALRFNWNPGLAMSPHDSRVIYFGANRLFKSYDRGDTWIGTKDLTKALERDRQSIMGMPGAGPMTAKNDGVSAYGTIVTIAESPVVPGVLWVGTDDGNLQLSRDSGVSWTNVADNVAKLPGNYYVESIEPSHYDAAVAYVAFDGHHSGDYTPYLFKTTDYGKTWTNLSATLPPRGHINVVREDRFNRNLLFAGTEFGFFVSLDGGRAWSAFMHNLPSTKIDDAVVHPRDQDLVLGTHGRSFYVLDDITPLQQLSDEVLANTEHLFRPRPAVLWNEDKQTWHGGADDMFRAKNAPAAIISYYLKAAAQSSVKIQVVDAAGTVVREFDGPRDAGIHRLPWDLRKAPAAGASAADAFNPPAAPLGDRIVPGAYLVRLLVNSRTSVSSLEVRSDPNQ